MVVSARPERRLRDEQQVRVRPYRQEIEAYARLERHFDEADQARRSRASTR
jgi:hypothetical protein